MAKSDKRFENDSSDYATASLSKGDNPPEAEGEFTPDKQETLNAQRALADLHHKMNTVLHESCNSVEDICDKVKRMLAGREKPPASMSDPTKLSQAGSGSELSAAKLMNALKVGLVQTQSENQLRLALDDDELYLKEKATEANEMVLETGGSPQESSRIMVMEQYTIKQ